MQKIKNIFFFPSLILFNFSAIAQTSSVDAVTFSNNGKYLFTAGWNASSDNAFNGVQIWDAETQKRIKTISDYNQKAAKLIAVSPDDKFLAIASSSKIYIYSIPDGKQIKVMEDTEDASVVYSLAYMPDGKSIVAGQNYGYTKTWDIETGKILKKYNTANTHKNLLAVHPRGNFFINVDENANAVNYFDISKKSSVAQIEVTNTSGYYVNCLAFSSDGKYYAAAGKCKPTIWHSEGNVLTARFGEFNGETSSILFSKTGKTIIFSSKNKVYLKSFETGNDIRTIETAGNIVSMAISANGQYILTACIDGTAKLIELSSGTEVHSFSHFADVVDSETPVELSLAGAIHAPSVVLDPDGHTAKVMDLCVTSDEKTLVSVSKDKTIRLWDVETGENIKTYRGEIGEGDDGGFFSASLSEDNKILAVGGYLGENKGIIRFLDFKTGKQLAKNNNNKNSVSGLAFSTEGDRFVSVGSDKLVRLWTKEHFGYMMKGKDFKTNALAFANNISSVSVSPDGDEIVVSCDYDKTVYYFNIFKFSPEGKPKEDKELKKHEYPVLQVAFSPKGKFILTADKNVAYLWDGYGEFQKEFASLSVCGKIVFSPDAKKVLIGNTVYEFPSGKKLVEFSKSTNVRAAIFIGNDKVATAGRQPDDKGGDLSRNDIYIWDATTGKELQHLNSTSKRINGISFTGQGLQIAFTDKNSNDLGGSYTTYEPKDIDGVFDFDKLNLEKYSGTEPLTTNHEYYADGKFLLRHVPTKGTESLADLEFGKSVIKPSAENALTSSFTVTKGGNVLTAGSFNITLFDGTGTELRRFRGHLGSIEALALSKDGKYFASLGQDGTIKLWSLEDLGKKENHYRVVLPLATIYISDQRDWICFTPNNYYASSVKGGRNTGFHINQGEEKEAKYYPFEQFDLVYNRPDKVLEKLKSTDVNLKLAYYKAYKKRLAKSGISESNLSKEINLPVLVLKTLSQTSKDKTIKLDFTASDEKFNLAQINVYVNDVPVLGSKGMKISGSKTIEKQLPVELTYGKNKVQVSVVNEKGQESPKETINVLYKEAAPKPNLYLVAIGISDYDNDQYDLKYAAKDANDLADLEESKKENYNEIKVLRLTDKKATKENIKNAKDFLKSAKTDDQVIVFVASHGVLDKDLNYYIATADMDFNNPAEKGLAYEELEALLDGIAPLKKVLLLDACHSGEVDKEEVQLMAANNKSSGDVTFRNAGAGIQKKNIGLKTASELMGELFTDLRRGTGATVISSAGGVEYAMESAEWKNGLFTYCLLHGLKDKTADANKDGQISLSELQIYLRNEVTKLSNGAQQPTSRIENMNMDFNVW